MKLFVQKVMLAAVLAGAVIAPQQALLAQQAPAVVVSVTNTNRLMGDIQYLTRAAGVPEFAGFINLFAGQYLQDLDGAQPAGMAVTFSGMAPQAVGFLPVKNLEGLLLKLEQQVGKPEEVGNGIRKIGLDRDMFFKQQGGFVLLSDAKENLGSLPNPAAALAGLDKNYDLAVQVNIQSIPAEMRKMAITEIKAGFERQMQEGALQGTPEERELQEKISRNALDSIVQAIEECASMKFGWQIDAQQQQTYMDFEMTAVPGTKLARQMGRLSNSTSNFTGFVGSDNAITMNFNSTMSPEEIQQATVALKAARDRALAQLDKEAELPDDATKKTVKEVVNSLMDVLEKTIQSGKLDGGAALALAPGALSFIAGGHVADPQQLDQAFRKMVEMGKQQPDFPAVQFNAEKVGEITFHKMTVPVPDDDARKVLGETVGVAFGTGGKSVFMAFGGGSMDLLKQAMQKSSGAQAVPPMQLNIALAPIMKFASTMDNNPGLAAAAEAIQAVAGKDHVRIVAAGIPNGVRYRLSIEEGVLQGAGAAMKAAQENNPGF